MRKSPIDMWRHVTDSIAAAATITAVVRVNSRESIMLKNIVASSSANNITLEIRINGITHWWKRTAAFAELEYNPYGGFIVKANSIVQAIATNGAGTTENVHVTIIYDRINH